MVSIRSSYKYLLLTSLLLSAAGCSVEKNTGATRLFHGMTSKYNIYFNGNESFKAGIARIDAGYQDNYSELLNIFEYSDPATASLCASNMERAVQKASKVISQKSITAKPEVKGNSLPNEKEDEFMNRKEYNEWVDDSYLLMGKARLYKRDFDLAKSTLSFNISSSADEHIRRESTIWLARVYNETGNYNESLRILNELGASSSLPDDLLGLYYPTLADLYLKQKRYDDAIEPLEKGLRHISGKRQKYRLTFLLAQLCERTGDGRKASVLYNNVIKMSPPYEVEFNARINIAGVFDPDSDNPGSLRKELEKMLKDPKNKEFADQIYFALGNLSKKEGNITEAISFYRKSASANSQNRNQKARSYLALAEHYFGIPDYLNAGRYYDSTTYVIDQKYPDYQRIRSISLSLNELVEQLLVINKEDSLQRVAKMPPEERNKLITSLIEDYNKRQSSGPAMSPNSERFNMGQYYENERRFQNNIEQEGKWYFYNQAALAFGRTEFRRRWGDRRLEDNWRRFNKARAASGQSSNGDTEKVATPADSAEKRIDEKNPEFYLRNLPVNDSLITISNGKIAEALLQSGKIYNDNFNDNARAIESFESLLQRFPGNSLEAETWYNLYRVYDEEKNARKETYRQRLIEKYPGNEYTRILSDPEYYIKLENEQKAAGRLYESAFDAFSDENYSLASSICDSALALFSRHELAPKFMLLKSYCTAKTTDERTVKEELTELVKRWPDTPESGKAKEIIAYLNKEIPQLQIEEDKQIAEEIYVEEMDSPHTFVLIIKNKDFNLNLATFDIISYNIDNYTNSNYRTQGSAADDRYIMLTVSGFLSLQDAMEYYNSFRTETVVRNPSGTAMVKFLIGRKNLETLVSDKNPDRYLLFFNEKYLEGNKRDF